MLRLFFCILLFLLSLLAVFRAPTNFTWKLSIAVTEFPHVFILLVLIAFALRFLNSKMLLTGDILCMLALLLFISPLFRAYSVSSDLQKNLNSALSTEQDSEESPFSILNMLTLKNNENCTYQTLTYKKIDNKILTLDFYPSKSSGPSPCIVVIHGGGWNSGDSQQLPEINSYFSSIGYNVASIHYRLAPQYLFPAPIEDTRDAIAYLKEQSTKLSIDTNNFILFGRSAGGQIALLAAYSSNDPSIKGVISFYAPADMVWAYSVPENPRIIKSQKLLRDCIGGSYEEVPDKFKKVSPIEFVCKTSPPTLIIHGVRDELVSYEHSIRLNKKLELNGVKHFLLTLPWATHACEFTLNGPSGQLSVYSIEHFLNALRNKEGSK